MATVVLGSQIFEVVPTVQATGSSGGDQLTISAGNTIPAIQGGAGVPSGASTYGVGSLYVDTTNSVLYLNTVGTTWVAITPPASGYVASAVAGTGIGVSGATGAVTFSNTGVLSITDNSTMVNVSATTGAITLTDNQPQQSITAAAAITSTETLVTKLTIGTGAVAGDTYLIQGFGTYTTTNSTVRMSTFNIRCGTAGTTADTVMGAIGPMTGTGNATAIAFAFEILLTFWVVGAAGTAIVNGIVSTNGVIGIIAAATFISANTATTSVNTTNNNIISFTFTTNATQATATFRNVSISKVR